VLEHHLIHMLHELPYGFRPFARISICPAATVMRKQEFHKLEFKTRVEQNLPAGRRVYSSPFVEDPGRIIRDHHIMLGELMENVKILCFNLPFQACEFLGCKGALLIEMRLLNMHNLRALIADTDGLWYRDRGHTDSSHHLSWSR
jgi:hypothetical protein